MDLSFGELAVIALFAVVFIGPKELPVVVRAVMRIYRQLADLASELRRGFEDIAKEPGIVDLAEEMEGTKRYIRDLDGQWREAYDMADITKTERSMPALMPKKEIEAPAKETESPVKETGS